MSDPVVDWADPCAVLPLMRERYYALISGQSVKELRHNGKVIVNETTKASELAALVADLERRCAEKTNPGTRRRFARRAGFRLY